jgi:hypothetical protein
MWGDDPLDPDPVYAHLSHDELEALEADRVGCLRILGGALFLVALIFVPWLLVIGFGVRLWQILDVLL